MKFMQPKVVRVLTLYLLGGISFLWVAIFFFGVFAVYLRWYPCLPILILLTFTFSAGLFAQDFTKESFASLIDEVCADNLEDIGDFYERVVD